MKAKSRLKEEKSRGKGVGENGFEGDRKALREYGLKKAIRTPFAKVYVSVLQIVWQTVLL